MNRPDLPNQTTAVTARPRLHPLVASAAIAVIVLCAVGITALVMSRSNATPSPYDAPPIAANAVSASAPDASPATTSAPVAPVTPVTPVYSTPSRGPDEPPVRVAAAETVCRDCGVVAAINDIKVKGRGTGVGAVGGAVVGGLVGNMIGAGRGKALATVAGAVGGGFGGNAIEKNVRSETEYQLVVRLDGGGTRTFTQAAPPPYAVGERVRVVNGHVERG